MSNKGRKFPAEPLTRHEIEALREAAGNRWSGVRSRAIIAVLWRCGLRAAECRMLDLKDVELDDHRMRVMRGKGRKYRVVGLDTIASAALVEWLDEREKLLHQPSGVLFCTKAGGRVPANYLRRLLPRLARKAGITKRVHPHGMRHSHACELRGEGVDVGIISKQLGHSSIATTVHYLDHIAPEAVVEAIRKRK